MSHKINQLKSSGIDNNLILDLYPGNLIKIDRQENKGLDSTWLEEESKKEVIDGHVKEVELENSPILSLFSINNEFNLINSFVTGRKGDLKLNESFKMLAISESKCPLVEIDWLCSDDSFFKTKRENLEINEVPNTKEFFEKIKVFLDEKSKGKEWAIKEWKMV